MPEPLPGPGLRVLVVDDCQDTAASLAMLLRLWGHESLIARDGPSALRLAESHCPDVVLLDIGLPGMSGHEVARRLRRANGRRPLVVSLSGYGREEDRRRALEAGCDLHLVKPVDPGELRALLAAPPRPVTVFPNALALNERDDHGRV